jgi:tetratricopeptide (TPR) repeat protein
MRDDRPRSAFTRSEWRAITQARLAATQQATAIWPHDDLLWRLESSAALAAAGAAGDSTADALEASAAIAAVEAVKLTPARAACQSALADALGARALRTGSKAFADSARAAYARAEELAPNDGWLLVSRARFELAMRNGVAALEVAQKLTGRYPEAAVGHVLSGTALLLLGRKSEARAAFAHSLDRRWEEDAGPQRAAVAQLLASKRMAPPRGSKRTRHQPAGHP